MEADGKKILEKSYKFSFLKDSQVSASIIIKCEIQTTEMSRKIFMGQK